MRRALSLQSHLLTSAGFRHAFFTRHHGWSTGAYSSLNFSAVVGDRPDAVEENTRLGAEALGVAAEHLCFADQVHGCDVAIIGPEDDASSLRAQAADAVMSREPDRACAVRTADCLPLLVADETTGAVMAIHAGWRGVEANIVGKALRRLREFIGGDGRLVAAIGPHISGDAFEVSEDVAARLERISPVPGVVDKSRARPHVDLERIVRGQLVEAAVDRSRIERVGGCTASDSSSYFSYRRDGPRSGRHLHAIVARR